MSADVLTPIVDTGVQAPVGPIGLHAKLWRWIVAQAGGARDRFLVCGSSATGCLVELDGHGSRNSSTRPPSPRLTRSSSMVSTDAVLGVRGGHHAACCRRASPGIGHRQPCRSGRCPERRAARRRRIPDHRRCRRCRRSRGSRSRWSCWDFDRAGDHARRGDRRGAEHRQRCDLRRRPHPAVVPAAGPGPGSARLLAVPPHRRPGDHAELRQRPEPGLGVRVAQPDGR